MSAHMNVAFVAFVCCDLGMHIELLINVAFGLFWCDVGMCLKWYSFKFEH